MSMKIETFLTILIYFMSYSHELTCAAVINFKVKVIGVIRPSLLINGKVLSDECIFQKSLISFFIDGSQITLFYLKGNKPVIEHSQPHDKILSHI